MQPGVGIGLLDAKIARNAPAVAVDMSGHRGHVGLLFIGRGRHFLCLLCNVGQDRRRHEGM